MKQVLEFADKYDMLPEGTAVICAVSGGADSVCLLHIIKDIAARRRLKVYAAHFNHCLRGDESDRDERFVRRLCEELGIRLFCASGDVRGYGEKNGIGTEEAARVLRYEFFEKTAAVISGSRVATAHNADDNAETLLMNLARGAGLKGLCGIPPVRDNYIRPLLCLSRGEIEDFLAERGIAHVEDSTNAENEYTRNRLRHDAVPVLRSINPNFAAAVHDTAELLREDEKLLDRLADEAVPIGCDERGRAILPVKALAAAEYPLAARAIRKAAVKLNCRPSAAHVRAVLEIAGSGVPSAETQLPGGVKVSREYDKVVFAWNEEPAAPGETELKWGEWVERGDIAAYFGPKEKIECDEYFPFKKSEICGIIRVRPRRSGDRICLDRRQGGKTLKKLFIEKKIPAADRENIPVVADEEKVLAISALGRSAELSPAEEADCIVALKKKDKSSTEE